MLFCWVLVKTTRVMLPANVQWKNLLGAAVLAGIGFTMSIFISNLAFTNVQLVSYAKVSVLIASLTATVIGLLILFNTKRAAVEGEG
jgi:NhaA family Na+:H+ antiporter